MSKLDDYVTSNNLSNARSYFSNDAFTNAAVLLDGKEGPGITATRRTVDRTLFITTRFLRKSKTMTMTVSTGIHCPKKYVPLMSQYIAKVNRLFVNGTFLIASNGDISVYFAHYFANGVVPKSHVHHLFSLAFRMINNFGDVLQKIASGELLSMTESDPSHHLVKMSLSSRHNDDDDWDDDDDDDDDDDNTQSGQNPLEALFRRPRRRKWTDDDQKPTAEEDKSAQEEESPVPPFSDKPDLFSTLLEQHRGLLSALAPDDRQPDGESEDSPENNEKGDDQS